MVKKDKITKSTADFLGIKTAPISHYLSTGCTILDLAISNRLDGGFAAGRIGHIWGVESSAKTMFIAEVLGSAQRQGGIAHFVDAEGTWDFQRAKELHDIDINALDYYGKQSMEEENKNSDIDSMKGWTIEYLFDTLIPDIIAKNKDEKLGIIGVDSLSAISSTIELEEDIDEKTYGLTRPQALSKGLRKYIWKLTKANLALIFIDQTRQNVGTSFGPKYVFSCGDALKFYASTRIFTSVKSKILNKFKKIIGVNIHFKVDKNKIAPPFREGDLRILFDYGIDNTGTSLDFLYENASDKVKGWHKFKEKKLRFDDMINYIEDNNLEKELELEVYHRWNEIYKVPDRKKRNR